MWKPSFARFSKLDHARHQTVPGPLYLLRLFLWRDCPQAMMPYHSILRGHTTKQLYGSKQINKDLHCLHRKLWVGELRKILFYQFSLPFLLCLRLLSILTQCKRKNCNCKKYKLQCTAACRCYTSADSFCVCRNEAD